MKTLLYNAYVITMDAQRTLLDSGAVCIDGEKIVDVGESHTLLQEYPDASLVDCQGNILLPGFIEPLAEVGNGLLGKQFSDDHQQWNALRRRFEADATPDEISMDGILLSRKALFLGITTLGIAYRNNLPQVHRLRHQNAATGQGIRLLSFMKAPVHGDYSESALRDAGHGFILDHPLAHLSPESLSEILQRNNKLCLLYVTPQYLEQFGSILFSMPSGRKFALVGCHGISFPQLQKIARRKMGVIYEPNTYLPSPHIVEMLHEGIPVALSSHSEHNRNPFDLFQTARRAQLFNITLYDDYHILPFGKTLEMLTIESAKVLGIEDITGSLEPGKDADINILSWHQPHLTPNFMPLQGMMSRASGRDIIQVIAKGRVVKADGLLVDPQSPEIPLETTRRWCCDATR